MTDGVIRWGPADPCSGGNDPAVAEGPGRDDGVENVTTIIRPAAMALRSTGSLMMAVGARDVRCVTLQEKQDDRRLLFGYSCLLGGNVKILMAAHYQGVHQRTGYSGMRQPA